MNCTSVSWSDQTELNTELVKTGPSLAPSRVVASGGFHAKPSDGESEADIDVGLAAHGLSSSAFRPALVAYLRGFSKSVPRYSLDIDGLCRRVAQHAHLSDPSAAFGAAVAEHISTSSREAAVADADSRIMRMTAKAPTAEVTDFGMVALEATCPMLSCLEPCDLMRFLSAESPLDCEGTLQKISGGIKSLVIKGNKNEAIVVGVSNAPPGGHVQTDYDETRLDPPLEVAAWAAGSALWVRELLRRTSKGLKDQFYDSYAILTTADTHRPKVAQLPILQASGSSNMWRLAVRVYFTKLIDGDRNVDGALEWVEMELTELTKLTGGTSSSRLGVRGEGRVVRRSKMFSCLFQELHDTVVLVLKCDLTSGAPPLEHLGELRAVEADGSIELRCCSFAEPYNFEATGEDNMLVTSPITRRFRKLFFQCCELSQPGVLLVSGPAGTGKTETMKDAAAELGARSIIFNAAKFQEDVDFATEFQSGSSFAQHLDTCAHAPGATFFIFEEFLTLPLFAVTFILERQKLYRRQHLSTLVCFTADVEKEGLSHPSCRIVLGDLAVWPEPGEEAVSETGFACMRFTKPDLRSIVRTLCGARGVEGADHFFNALRAFGDKLPHGEATDDGKNVMPDCRQMKWGLRDYMAIIERVATGKVLETHAGGSPLEDFAEAVASWPTLRAHKLASDRHRTPEERTQLIQAIETGDQDCVADAIAARNRACSDGREDGAPVTEMLIRLFPRSAHSAYSAMDIALLAMRFPQHAVNLLNSPGLSQKRSGETILMLEDAAALDMLLPAVLSSKSVDQILNTPPFRAILASKMAALWPLWTAEMFAFGVLICSYTVWGFTGNALLAAVAVGIAVAFCIAEALQIQAAFKLRVLVQGHHYDHLFDPYNIIDTATSASVIVTAIPALLNDGGAPSPSMAACTVLLLMVKLITTLRALEPFGFLVSMMLTTVGLMANFMLLLSIFIAGFAVIFGLLNTGEYDLDDSEDPNSHENIPLSMRLHQVYNLALLGEFDDAQYAARPSALIFFQLVTFAITVVMLNILISIVSEGYGRAQSMRDELDRREKAGSIIDLEAVYLRPFYSTTVLRRGKTCCLTHYPQRLLTAARAIEKFLSFFGAARSHVTSLSCIPVEYNAIDAEAPWQATERALVKSIGVQMERQFEFIEKLLKHKSAGEDDKEQLPQPDTNAQW